MSIGYLLRITVPPTRGRRRRCPPVRSSSGVGRSDVGGSAGGPRLATVAVLAAGPVLLLRGDGRKESSIFTSQFSVLENLRYFANDDDDLINLRQKSEKANRNAWNLADLVGC